VNKLWRILWVDDDPDFLHAARRLLRRSARIRAEIETAHRTEEALRILGSKPVDVVVTSDRVQPTGGGPLLDEVRRRRPELKRVLVSGYDLAFLQRRGADSQADLILAKDDLMKELDAKLTDFLEARL